MNIIRLHSESRFGLLLSVCLCISLVFISASIASPLKIETQSHVNEQGQVGLSLMLKNSGASPIFHIHPMLHFHHTMAMLPMIHRLAPGDSITIENGDHPPVRLPGSYPIVAMVNYRQDEDGAIESAVHTNSFYFKEALPSQIEGSIVSTRGEGDSLLTVVLKNASSSFKNIRLMLVLPPEIQSDTFQGMKGFTLRSGEEKTFSIPVKKMSEIPGGQFPVHLLVEYGQMLNHYSGDIAGTIDFGSFWGEGPIWPHFLVVVFLTYTIFAALKRRKLDSIPDTTSLSV